MPTGKPRRPGDGSKVAGAGWKIPAKELHHWWPKGLSKFWRNSDGLVSRLNNAGEVLQLTPEKFGALANGHAIKLEGPWNGTIEPIFDFADANLPNLVGSTLSALADPMNSKTRVARSGPHLVNTVPMSPEDREAFAEGLASLVLRSPEYRNRIRITSNYYRDKFGLPEVDSRDHLIAANIHQYYSTAVADFRHAYLIFLYSPKTEFIFGEGYLNNVSEGVHTSNLRATLPLTPELAVVAFWGNGSCPPAKVCSLSVSDEIVSGINELTQIYTKEYVFFRSQRPTILDAFSQNEFLQLQYHQDPLIEAIIETVRTARL